MPYQKDDENSFYNAICYAARFSLTNKKETCDENEMKDIFLQNVIKYYFI